MPSQPARSESAPAIARLAARIGTRQVSTRLIDRVGMARDASHYLLRPEWGLSRATGQTYVHVLELLDQQAALLDSSR